jgi:uncharacterized cupin superfamily protein
VERDGVLCLLDLQLAECSCRSQFEPGVGLLEVLVYEGDRHAVLADATRSPTGRVPFLGWCRTPSYDPTMVAEATLEQTAAGLVPAGEGWFVLNAREARWRHREGRGESLAFEGEPEFPQVGINLIVLAPGEPIGMYHWEADQENFLVLSGEALLIVEGEERPLRRWDFVHCPALTKHMIVAAGRGPCVILAVGAREHQAAADWGGYTVDETAIRHGAGVEHETTDAEQAYAGFPQPEPTRYREGWLPS